MGNCKTGIIGSISGPNSPFAATRSAKGKLRQSTSLSLSEHSHSRFWRQGLADCHLKDAIPKYQERSFDGHEELGT